jgi:hypothetical protein
MFLRDTNATLRDDGVLELSFQHAGRRSFFRIAPWRDGFVTYRVRGDRVEPTDLWSMVVLAPPGASSTRNPAVATFLSGIPAAVQNFVRPYRFGQCVLLRSLAALAQTEDLAASNPNLLWLLAAAGYDGRVSPDAIGRLCTTKQVEVLRELTGTGTKAQVKFLRKVVVAEGTLTEARDLHAALCDASILAAVRHLAAIPIELLSLLTAHTALAREDVAADVAARIAAAKANKDSVDRLCERVAALAAATRNPTALAVQRAFDAPRPPARPVRRALPIPAPPRRAPHVIASRAEYPPPPLLGTDTIVPITSIEELAAEGRAQRNCVADYAASIFAGDRYVYRVLAPERATLEIRLGGIVPELGQLKLARNREPSRATFAAVRRWFKEAGPAARGGSTPSQ